jgi:uncharacterized protein
VDDEMAETQDLQPHAETPGDRDPIELVRTLYAAFEDGDHATIRGCLTEDLEWRQAASYVPAADETAIGADHLIDRVIRPLEYEWATFTEEVDRIVGTGPVVVATGTYRGVHATTGRTLAAEFCHLWEVEDGRIRTFRQYTDTAAFAAATGRPAVDAG